MEARVVSTLPYYDIQETDHPAGSHMGTCFYRPYAGVVGLTPDERARGELLLIAEEPQEA